MTKRTFTKVTHRKRAITICRADLERQGKKDWEITDLIARLRHLNKVIVKVT